MAAWLAFIAYLAGLTSTLGVLIAAVNSQCRLIFNAGREGLLPRWIGYVHPVRRTPVNAIIAFVGIAGAITLVWALGHWIGGHGNSLDALNFFFESSTMGTILILFVYFAANVALPFYYRKYRPDEFNMHQAHRAAGPRRGRDRRPDLLPVQAAAAPAVQLVPVGRLGLIVVSILYSIWLVRRDPGLGDRVGSIVADGDVRPHPLDRRPPRPSTWPAGGHHGGGRAAGRTRSGSPTTASRSRPRTRCWPAQAADRRLRAFLVNTGTGESTDVVVSLTHSKVVSARTLDPGTDGQMPILDSDFAAVDEITKADPEWRAAMARRGYHDVSQIRTCPITAGAFGPPDDDRRRMVRVLAFVQAGEHDLAWAHPVDGVAAYVDLIAKKVFKVTDEFELPVPAESGDYDDEAVRGPHRTTLKPIEITQPEGPSFTLDGNALRWQDWSMRIGFDAREGLTLHQVSLRPARPVLYRASIPEMVVPYGDPKFRYWQAYFDTGEYLVGKWANSLELGCDCLGEIAYLDATVTDDTGQPRTIPNAICIHEEDFGILWKHTDIFNGSAQSRRQRRLVVSYFTTVGNYDYGFYWYFYLDGTIELEIKATGVLFTSAYPGGRATRTPPRSRPGWPGRCTSTCSAPGWT